MDITRFLEKKIYPRAEKLDTETRKLKRALGWLGKKRWLALRAPKEYGGQQFTAEEYFSFVELLQSYSGALGFLQRQHQAAARFIANSTNDLLKEKWLPRMAKGKDLVGVSLSHLRHPDHPQMVGRLTEEGWRLSGEVAWVSGYRIFNHLLLGFVTEDRCEEGFALLPFKKGRTLKFSKPLPTIALSSMQTVHLKAWDHIVPENAVFALKPLGSYQRDSSLLGVHFVNLSAVALGFKRELEEEITPLYERLCEEYTHCRAAFLEKVPSERLHSLYATMHRIATDFCHLSRFQKGTEALIIPNATERRYRELMLFGAIVSEPEVLEACLRGVVGCFEKFDEA